MRKLVALAVSTAILAAPVVVAACHSNSNDTSNEVVTADVQETVDVCFNLEGEQEFVPEGMVKSDNGDCVEKETPPVDIPPAVVETPVVTTTTSSSTTAEVQADLQVDLPLIGKTN